MYFLARHTAIDCHEKRGRRGYLFLIGDECPYPRVKRDEVEQVIGDAPQTDIPVAELLAELEKRWHVFFVLPRMTHHWNNPEVHRAWTDLLGQNVLRLEDPAGICELIASTIGLAEGKADMAQLRADLSEEGASTSVAQAVGKALAAVGDEKDDASSGLTRL
jgi:hypothetical protein